MIVQSAANRVSLKEVEEKILRTIAEAKDILADENAIKILDESKVNSKYFLFYLYIYIFCFPVQITTTLICSFTFMPR